MRATDPKLCAVEWKERERPLLFEGGLPFSLGGSLLNLLQSNILGRRFSHSGLGRLIVMVIEASMAER